MEIYTSHNSHYLCYDYLIVKQITPKLSGVKQPFIMIMDFACQKFGLDTRMPSFSVPESWGFKWKTPKAEGEIIQICCVYAREKEREKRQAIAMSLLRLGLRVTQYLLYPIFFITKS